VTAVNIRDTFPADGGIARFAVEPNDFGDVEFAEEIVAWGRNGGGRFVEGGTVVGVLSVVKALDVMVLGEADSQMSSYAAVAQRLVAVTTLRCRDGSLVTNATHEPRGLWLVAE